VWRALRSWLFGPTRPPAATRAPDRPRTTAELLEAVGVARSPKTRAAAARELATRLPADRDKIVAALVDAAFDEDVRVREAARAPLYRGKIGEPTEGVIDALRRGLRDREASDRGGAVSSLGSFVHGTAEFFADMMQIVADDPTDGVRQSAAYYVAQTLRHHRRTLGDPVTSRMDDVERALDDRAPAVRRYLAEGVLHVRPESVRAHAVVVETLLEKKAYEHELSTAVELLTVVGEARATELLARAEAALPEGAPRRAWLALARGSWPATRERAVRDLEAMLEVAATRAEAALVAAKLPIEPARLLAPKLARLARSDRDTQVRTRALGAFLRDISAPEERLELARAAVAGSDSALRRVGFQVLGTIYRVEVLAIVLPYLADDAVAEDAARAVISLGPAGAPAVPALARRVTKDASYIYVWALEAIGAAARDALPVLVDVAVAPGKHQVHVLGAMKRIGLGDRVDDALLGRLLALLDDASPSVRDACADVLETAPDPLPARVREGLAKSIVHKDGSGPERARRVDRIARAGAPAVAPLVCALEDVDEAVADLALQCLERMGAVAVPELRRIADDLSSPFRRRAAFVLERIG
jgi:hypothetical protein